MADAILDKENEYVTAQTFQEALDDLKRSITDLGERIAQSDKKADDARQAVDDRIRQERDARQADMAGLRSEVHDSQKKSEEMLSSFNSKLDTLSQNLLTSIAELTGTVKNWSSVMDSRDQAHKEQRERIEKQDTRIEMMGRDISLVTSNQASLLTTVGEVRKTIYGVDGEEPPSLFSLISDVKSEMTKGFEVQQGQLTSALALTQQNSLAIEAIQRAQAEEKERWQKRKDTAKEFAKAMLSSKRFWAIFGTAILGVILGLFPEAREVILQVLQLLLKS